MSAVVTLAFLSSIEAMPRGVSISSGLGSSCYVHVAVPQFLSVLSGGSLVESVMCLEVPMVGCGPSRHGMSTVSLYPAHRFVCSLRGA